MSSLELGNELHTMIHTPSETVQGKKALVVISNGKSTRANGYLERLEAELKLDGVEYVIMAQNAKDTLRVDFLNDPVMLSNEDCVAIYQKSYR